MEILINGVPMEENMQGLLLECIGTIGMLARLTDSDECHQMVASTLRRMIDKNFGEEEKSDGCL